MKYIVVFFLILVFVLAAAVGPIAAQDDIALEEANKAAVLQLFEEVWENHNLAVVDELVAEDLIQHDPTLDNGRAAYAEYLTTLTESEPPLQMSVLHILADGDFVAVHSHISATLEDEFTGQAAMDLFRLDEGIIVEHWRVVQSIPSSSISGNSMVSALYEYDGEPPELSEEEEEANKQLVIEALNGVFNERRLELFDELWAGDAYIQHNPLGPNGTSLFAAAFNFFVPEGSHLTTFHAVADGPLVFAISQMSPPDVDPEDEFAGSVWGDLFLAVDGKFVEHWDVIQEVPAESVSGNSMFSSLYAGGE